MTDRLGDQITKMEEYILELVEEEGLRNLKEEGYNPNKHFDLMREFEEINEELNSAGLLNYFNPFNRSIRELAKREKELQKKLEFYNDFILNYYIKIERKRLEDFYKEANKKSCLDGEGKKPRGRSSILKKIGTVIGMGLLGAGIVFGASYIGKQNHNNLPNIYKNMEKINDTLHEKGFSYCSDNLTDNINLSEIVPYNFKIIGQDIFGIDIAIDDSKIPKDIKTFKALAELGSILEYHKEIAPQMNCYKFLVGKRENYPVDVTIPVMDHPNDIVPPSKLIKTKSGDCEDYALLDASYYNAQNIPAFVVIDRGHAVAAVGDISYNPNKLKENIKENKTFVIGSSEYLNKGTSFNFSITTEPTCAKHILDNLKTKYSSDNDIRAIISKENIWTQKGPYYFNVSKFKSLDEERAKEAADYLKMGISKEQIDKMSGEYYKFCGTLAKKAIKAQKGNDIKFYQEIKRILDDSYEEKVAAYLFNETF